MSAKLTLTAWLGMRRCIKCRIIVKLSVHVIECLIGVIVLFVLHGSGAGDPVRPLAVLLAYRTLSDEEKTDQCYEKRRRETSAESWSV